MEYLMCSTFISGLEKEVESTLTDYVKCKIVKVFDGLIIYKTEDFSKTLSIPFFNNTYYVIANTKVNVDQDLNVTIKNLLKKISVDYCTLNKIKPKDKKTFKILAFDKNRPTSIDYKNLLNLEKDINKHLKIQVGQRKHDLEFIFTRRSEGLLLFLFKLSHNRITEKTLQKGELRPELAFMLTKLADLKQSEIVLDPFCGYGGIVRQIVKNFKYKICFASDNDDNKVLRLKKEYKNNNKQLYIKSRDACNLDYLNDNSVNKIITDPPWNIFEASNKDFVGFYSDFLKECYRVLTIDGLIIILMGNVIDFEKAIKNVPFQIKKTLHVLVNGKKANIYVLSK